MPSAQDPALTPFVPTDYHWLMLRFEADRASRAPDLLDRVVASLASQTPGASAAGRPLRVLDLGAGAGANLLYLAPRLPAATQEWTLIDRDDALVRRVEACFEAFVPRIPGMAAAPARVDFPGAAVTYRTITGDFLRADCPIYRERYDLIVANAVFDLLSTAQLARFLELAAMHWQDSRPPLYFTINLDRELTFSPAGTPGPGAEIAAADDGAAGDDARMVALFHAHMQREQAFGRAMGPDSAGEMLRLLRDRGLAVQAAPSPWLAGATERDFLHANLDFVASATRDMIAAGQGGGLSMAEVDAWLAHRRAGIDRGALGMVVAHQDIWATWGQARQDESV